MVRRLCSFDAFFATCHFDDCKYITANVFVLANHYRKTHKIEKRPKVAALITDTQARALVTPKMFEDAFNLRQRLRVHPGLDPVTMIVDEQRGARVLARAALYATQNNTPISGNNSSDANAPAANVPDADVPDADIPDADVSDDDAYDVDNLVNIEEPELTPDSVQVEPTMMITSTNADSAQRLPRPEASTYDTDMTGTEEQNDSIPEHKHELTLIGMPAEIQNRIIKFCLADDERHAEYGLGCLEPRILATSLLAVNRLFRNATLDYLGKELTVIRFDTDSAPAAMFYGLRQAQLALFRVPFLYLNPILNENKSILLPLTSVHMTLKMGDKCSWFIRQASSHTFVFEKRAYRLLVEALQELSNSAEIDQLKVTLSNRAMSKQQKMDTKLLLKRLELLRGVPEISTRGLGYERQITMDTADLESFELAMGLRAGDSTDGEDIIYRLNYCYDLLDHARTLIQDTHNPSLAYEELEMISNLLYKITQDLDEDGEEEWYIDQVSYATDCVYLAQCKVLLAIYEHAELAQAISAIPIIVVTQARLWRPDYRRVGHSKEWYAESHAVRGIGALWAMKYDCAAKNFRVDPMGDLLFAAKHIYLAIRLHHPSSEDLAQLLDRCNELMAYQMNDKLAGYGVLTKKILFHDASEPVLIWEELDPATNTTIHIGRERLWYGQKRMVELSHGLFQEPKPFENLRLDKKARGRATDLSAWVLSMPIFSPAEIVVHKDVEERRARGECSSDELVSSGSVSGSERTIYRESDEEMSDEEMEDL